MRSSRRYSSWLAALFVALPLFTALSPASGAGDRGRIAFSKGKQIFTIDSTGRQPVRLTDTYSHNWDPAWSPDGTKIAYICLGWPRRNGELCVMRSDGSGARRLTKTTAAERNPTWSPDGRRLAFVRSDASGSRIIVRRPVRGAVETEILSFRTVVGSLDWSPDGGKFLFTWAGVGFHDIYTVKEDGSDLTNLTMSPGSESSASWSPDGKEIAFERAWNLYTMNASGGGERALGVVGQSPSWSPDGRLLAFDHLNEDKNEWGLGVVRPDGSRARIIVTSRARIMSSAWRP